ncbi:hypothetical protein SAMN06298211_101100 [Prevotellaceae bacterium MN60]|nr:hypothetical protein SAMN06298211_101100 [Prevotellaceae bacterium MN60]
MLFFVSDCEITENNFKNIIFPKIFLHLSNLFCIFVVNLAYKDKT